MLPDEIKRFADKRTFQLRECDYLLFDTSCRRPHPQGIFAYADPGTEWGGSVRRSNGPKQLQNRQ